LDARPRLELLRVAVAQLAVIGVLADLEVDVAAGGVGVALIDQPLHHALDVADVLRRPREVVDAGDAQPLEVVLVVGGDALGQLLPIDVLPGGLVDDLVIDVGDVDDEGHLVANVRQVAFDGIEDDRADHVADVAGFVDGRAAQVHADLAGPDGAELFLLPGQRVVDAQGHVGPSPANGWGRVGNWPIPWQVTNLPPHFDRSAPPPGSRWLPPGRWRPPFPPSSP